MVWSSSGKDFLTLAFTGEWSKEQYIYFLSVQFTVSVWSHNVTVRFKQVRVVVYTVSILTALSTFVTPVVFADGSVICFHFSLYSFMGRGLVDAPFSYVVEYIKNFKNRFDWDKLLVVNLTASITACLSGHKRFEVWPLSPYHRNMMSAKKFQRMTGFVSTHVHICTCNCWTSTCSKRTQNYW